VILLWPYYDSRFRLDPGELLDRYVDGPTPMGPDEMRRGHALRIEADRRRVGPWSDGCARRCRPGSSS
jgi:hypothetical protein